MTNLLFENHSQIGFFRKLAYLAYTIFFRFTPEDYRPYSIFFPKIRQILVKCFLYECGEGIVVKHNAEVSPSIILGDYSELGTRCMIQSNVKIGNHVIMGPDVKIYSRNHIYKSLQKTISQQGKVQLKTIIGNDVWIGANVIITAGCTIGNHAVIGAGSVVTKEIHDNMVVGGVPSKLIKIREQKK